MKKIILSLVLIVSIFTVGCVKAHLPNPETDKVTFRLCTRVAENVRGKMMSEVANILGSPYSRQRGQQSIWDFYRYDAGQGITLYIRVNFIVPEAKAHPLDGGFYCNTVEPYGF